MNKLLRVVGFFEGCSFLFLLGVAMPLKYVYNHTAIMPYAGFTHGFLFLAFLLVLLMACHKNSWSIFWFLGGLLASVLPFGTFVFDFYVKRWERRALVQDA